MNSSLVGYEARKLNIEFLRPRFSARASPPAFLCGKYLKFFTEKLKMVKKASDILHQVAAKILYMRIDKESYQQTKNCDVKIYIFF